MIGESYWNKRLLLPAEDCSNEATAAYSAISLSRWSGMEAISTGLASDLEVAAPEEQQKDNGRASDDNHGQHG